MNQNTNTKIESFIILHAYLNQIIPIIHSGWNSADLGCCNEDMVVSRAGVQSALNVRKVQLK